MLDREKVIKGLEFVIEESGWDSDRTFSEELRIKAVADAITLLKERDAIVRCKDCRYGEPVKNGAGDDCIQCNNDDLWLDGSVNFPDWFCADGKGDEVE